MAAEGCLVGYGCEIEGLRGIPKRLAVNGGGGRGAEEG